jgi:hypothetical protein
MGSLWKFEALFLSEHTLDEPVQLLSANERYSDESLLGLRDLGADQSERGTSFLMPGKPVPKAHDKHGQQLVDGVEAIELRQLSAP